MSTTRFSSRLCLIKGHRFLKKQYETFLSLLIPQKRWNILFSSENDRFFQLAHHRAKSSAMFELYWLPVSTLSELRHHVLTSRAPFEPMEKCEMKFRLVSSNSRGFSLARAQVFCMRNWRYFKRGLFIYFVVDTWNVLPVMSENDKSAGLWKVKVRSCFVMCLLMVTTYSNNEAGDQSEIIDRSDIWTRNFKMAWKTIYWFLFVY